VSASPVRELARRHAAGELSLEEYRARRHELIDDIVTGKTPLIYDQHQPAGHSRIKRTKSHNRIVIGGAALILLIIIGSVLLLLLPRHQASRATESGTRHSRATVPDTSPGSMLVQTFLRSNDWSTMNVRNFVDQWNSLPQAERENARQDYRFPRLTSELRQQIVSQRAMAALTPGSGDTKAQLASLQTMANMLGVKTDE
jgi:hypothetical protein